MNKKIYRNTKDKWLAGVIQGVSDTYGWDANIVRLIVVLAAFFTVIFPFVIGYIIAAILIPSDTEKHKDTIIYSNLDKNYPHQWK